MLKDSFSTNFVTPTVPFYKMISLIPGQEHFLANQGLQSNQLLVENMTSTESKKSIDSAYLSQDSRSVV